MANKNLYVITPIFNPFNFKSRYRLYRNFAKHMRESGAVVVTIEAAFGNHPFYVTDSANPMDVQLRTNIALFHKERLINIGIAHLLKVIPDAWNIAWIDADVTFANPDWVDQSVHKLMHHHVIQPFGQAANLNASEEIMWTCPSSFKSFLDGRGYHQEPPLPNAYIFKGHPGLAWAATRAALDSVGGLYDTCIAGSADTVMSNCLKGDYSVYLPSSPTEGMINSMKKWETRCKKFIKGNIGYTKGTLLHHWHGASENRGYEKRWSILSFHRFDPVEDLTMDTQGLWRWSGNKPRLEDDIRLSLGSRDEDS